MEIIALKLSVTTCFLVKAGSRYVLIDTGYEYDWDIFRQKLQMAGIGLSRISHIILTHHHDDHCGLLHHILNENPQIRVVMSYRAKDLLLRGKNDDTHGGGLLNKRIELLLHCKQLYLSAVLKKPVDKEDNLKFAPYRAREGDILIPGETKLQDLGIDLTGRIFETPGHTVDSISVLLDDGACFVGDAAANFLHFAGTKNCVIFIADLDQYYSSWRRIIAMGARRIYPAHGKPFPVAQLEKNIGKNNKRSMVLGR